MRLRILFGSILTAVVVVSCQHIRQPAASTGAMVLGAPLENPTPDTYQWLEEVESERSLAKVKGWNARTTGELESDARFKTIEADVRKIILATDRIPYGYIENGFVYNFWQDQKNVRGLWRRATLAEYSKRAPKWETILDLDAIATTENENWVWKGASCLQPEHRRCLLRLSRGGKDAVVLREFDIETKSFVVGGFVTPESKSYTSWVDKDRIYIATNFGEGSMTKSGYARQVRAWKRGQPLLDAVKIFESSEDDVSANGYISIRPDGTERFIIRELTSVDTDVYHVKPDGSQAKLPIPADASFSGVFRGYALGVIRSALVFGGKTFQSGSLLAWKLSDLQAAPDLIFAPNERESVAGTSEAKDVIYMNIMSNVKSRMMRVTLDAKGAWKIDKMSLPDDGTLSTQSASSFENEAMFSYASFLTPNSLLYLKTPVSRARVLRSLPARFNAAGLISEQLEATSKDGTKIPYFVVRPKTMKYDGENVTMLTAYGGFNISSTPYYMNSIGKVFSEKGGVYVLANIRGGGEFGPKWHEAARLKNRQRAYDDFQAVAEDLIKRRITSPRRLGIQGGSNGGLLVGVSFTQRPDLFSAVLCEVPLADMLRYHKLLAGASWMGEYGNPDDPEMAPVLRAYSPYHNLVSGRKYPRVFYITSTRDDRVHPAHARKMAAKMEEYGMPFLYFENTEGGHSAAANLEQRIKFSALEWTYVWRQLGR